MGRANKTSKKKPQTNVSVIPRGRNPLPVGSMPKYAGAAPGTTTPVTATATSAQNQSVMPETATRPRARTAVTPTLNAVPTTTMPTYTGPQAMVQQANLPAAGSIPLTQAVPVQRPAAASASPALTTTVPSTQRSGPLDFTFAPRPTRTVVQDLRATSQAGGGLDRGMTNIVAQPYAGETPMPRFTGSLPRFFPSQAIGPVPAMSRPQNEPWRNYLGLQQGVTYATNQMQYGNVPAAQTISPTLPPAQAPRTMYEAGMRGDNSREDKALLKSRTTGPFSTPYGDIRYTPPITNQLAQAPAIGATGVYDDTIKYRGRGTTTDLYNPATLQGFTFTPIGPKATPVADRRYDTIERIRLNRGTLADNTSAAEELPQQMPVYQGNAGGGYGGGGGGGGYGYSPSRWLPNLYQWRL